MIKKLNLVWSTFAIALAMTLGFNATRANAVLAIPSLNVYWLVMGGIVTGEGLATITDTHNSLIFGIAESVIGIIILDDQNQAVPQFVALTDTDSVKLGVTLNQQTAYNSQLDEINDMAQTISTQVAAYAQGHTTAQTLAFSHDLWEQNAISIDSSAFAVVKTIAAQNQKTN